MADGSHTSDNLSGQASGTVTPTKLQMMDDQGFPLIPYDQLPFQKFSTRGGKRFIDSHWHVEVPSDYNAAELLGQQMALAFLRAAPMNGNRQSHMEWLAMFILPDQVKAIEQGGSALRIVTAFWGTIARFAEPAATLENVERWRGRCIEVAERDKVAMAEYMAAAAKEQSERARHAANARWAKRSKQS
jgi:hypothetical protein